MSAESSSVIIYTDGACDPNPGPGGWAAMVIANAQKKELSGNSHATTNNRMEMTAAIEALKELKSPSKVVLFTDSQYLMRGITEWLPNWIKKNWRTTSGPVANKDLWLELLSALQPHKVEWRWLRGHVGDPNNSRVDYLARQARRKIRL